MSRFPGGVRLAISLGLALLLSSCAAARVATHDVSLDPVDVPAGTYSMDADHWSLLFDVGHFGYSRFVMRFDKATATLDLRPNDLAKTRLEATVEAASVDTNVSELDAMVKELLKADRYPDIRFVSTRMTRTGEATGTVTGALTIAGETHPVTLDVAFNGASPNPLTGDDTMGFSATGSFRRSLWGLSDWRPAVGDEVRVRIQAEFKKPKETS
ncbi:polyisoprenoid-binding protein YceI [Parvibaculum indicum]|uniref:YceI family protein n=1 Tax=Parvibaculum indicum TaxID=562969 RepID=UPI00141F237E|nr:YceI family protein [Parvibaculum indicum]NIJ41803.1 polyisoprenoid-binding protein YceI [Parvibaculum indicum]